MFNTEVVQLVAHYARESTQECIRLYSENLLEGYKKVGETITERAHQYADAINGLNDIVGENRLKKSGQIVYELLEKFSQDDPDKMYLRKVTSKRTGYKELNEVKLWELHDRYLLEPCRQLAAMNQDGWCETLEFDKVFVSHRETDELLKYCGRFTACNRLVKWEYDRLYQMIRAEAIKS